MPSDEAKLASRVTIVVTQRERTSAMQEALESIYDDAPGPVELVYVTGAIAGRARRWLEREARSRGFSHVEAGRRLTPAEARNIGLAHAKTEFVLFIENDVVLRKGSLAALVACAQDTGADLVAPVTCEGRPLHTIVHHVGPYPEDEAFIEGPDGERDFREDHPLQGEPLEAVASSFVRRRTQNCEFHCFLARRSIFDKVGDFEPDIVSKETLYFSWAVNKAGGGIWLEPAAVATFLLPSDTDPIRLHDLPDFLLRWSVEWQDRSHDRVQAAWGLRESGYIAKRRAMSNWRIVDHVVKPALEKTPYLGRRWGFVERGVKLVYPLLAIAASWMVRRYDRERRRAVQAGARA